jgi:flavodoxin
MNAVVVYYSVFGNTKSVAEAIGQTLDSGAAVRTVSARDLAAVDLMETDLLVAGTPTHVMKVPADFRAILGNLPKDALDGARVAAFDTSYRMSGLLSRFTASKSLLRELRRLGGKRIGRTATFQVVDKEGPLYEGENERAKAWAEGILAEYE